MDFNLAGFIFWSFIVVPVLLILYGVWKKSRKSLIISGLALSLPMLYFGVAANNWFKLLVIVPLIPFVLAFYTKIVKND